MRILVVTTRLDPDDPAVSRRVHTAQSKGADIVLAAPFGAFHRQPLVDVPCIDLPSGHGIRKQQALRARRRVLRHRGAEADLVVDLDATLSSGDAFHRGSWTPVMPPAACCARSARQVEVAPALREDR